MDEIKPKRKYTRKKKPMDENTNNEVASETVQPETPAVLENETGAGALAGETTETAATPGVTAEASIATPESAEQVQAAATPATEEAAQNISTAPTASEQPEQTVANLDGLKSCSRCGADESPTVPLTIVGNEKLCPNH